MSGEPLGNSEQFDSKAVEAVARALRARAKKGNAVAAYVRWTAFIPEAEVAIAAYKAHLEAEKAKDHYSEISAQPDLDCPACHGTGECHVRGRFHPCPCPCTQRGP